MVLFLKQVITDVIKKVVFGPSPHSDASVNSGNVNGNSASTSAGAGAGIARSIDPLHSPPVGYSTNSGSTNDAAAAPTNVSTSTEIHALQQQQRNEQLQQRHLEELETTRQTAFQAAFGILLGRMKHFDGLDPEQQQRLLSLTITAEARKEWEPLLGDEWEIIRTLQGKLQMHQLVKGELQANMDKNEELFAEAFVLQKQYIESAIKDHDALVAQLTAQLQQKEAEYAKKEAEYAVQKKRDERVALANAEQLQRFELEVKTFI